MNTIYDSVDQIASEDANTIKNILHDKYNMDVSVDSIDFKQTGNDNAVAYITFKDLNTQKKYTIRMDYDISESNDSLYVSQDRTCDDAAKALKDGKTSSLLTESSSITSSSKTRILGAEEDFDNDSEVDDDEEEFQEDDDSFKENLDEMSDQIEELQDSIDDIQEDDPIIDTDNNIDNHYIAECERCHGIFISAVTESDQHIEYISGMCPLCEHDTNQYLKWIIRSANSDNT